MKKLSMYSLSTCPWCSEAKKFFESRGISYSYIDYDLASAEEQQRISKEMSGFQVKGFPVIKIGEEAVIGYSLEKYSELVRSMSSESSQ
ncbi:MAG: glutaredoxin family protein [Syntrophorhabdales bacterium]|jgi:glutaredoxin